MGLEPLLLRQEMRSLPLEGVEFVVRLLLRARLLEQLLPPLCFQPLSAGDLSSLMLMLQLTGGRRAGW